jgi:alkylation response protein AidB-like acyl-CoA dehydrogenase
MWGTGPSAADLLDLVRADGGLSDSSDRQRAAALYIESEVMRLSRLRTLSAQLQGRTPGAEASIPKIMGDEHGQHVLEFAKHLAGANGMLTGSGPAGKLSVRAQAGPTENRFARAGSDQFPDVDPVWHYGFLFSPALTIGGGTFAIQRNIVAEHVLGLPRDIDPDRGLTWSQTRQRVR